MKKAMINGIDFYTINNLHEFQLELLDILKYIDDLCSKNDIEYFLDGGSSIGAKRHNGFIPWDDDLDIALLKKDYIKLVDVIRKDSHRDFYLYDEDLKNSFCGYLAKKSNYFQVIKNDNKKSLIPPKIDIRPFNVIEENKEKESYIYREIANYLTFNSTSKQELSVVKDALTSFSSNESFYKWYNLEYGVVSNYTNSVLASPYYKYSYEFSLPYTKFFPLVRSTFENVTVNTPTDEFLNNIYGDFYLLPNVEERTPVANEIVKLSDFYSSTLNDYIYRRKNEKKVNMILFFKYAIIKLLNKRY